MEVAPRHPDRIAAARMAIINHDRIKAELLRFYCSMHWGFEVVALECTGPEGITAITRTKPDLVLVSLAMPDMNAGEILRQTATVSPGSKIIGQTNLCTDYLIHLLGGLECQGLVLDTEETLDSLGQAIERVRQGLRAISPSIVRCQTALRGSPVSFTKLLSRREEQVLICIAHSLTDIEIGVQLSFSTATALSHRKKIMGKLGIHSTPKLIRYCSDRGFNSVPPPSSPARVRS